MDRGEGPRRVRLPVEDCRSRAAAPLAPRAVGRRRAEAGAEGATEGGATTDEDKEKTAKASDDKGKEKSSKPSDDKQKATSGDKSKPSGKETKKK